MNSENFEDKIKRKIREEPLVPIGAGVTVLFLTLGFRSFIQGKKRQSQILMRGRVIAQGFTVCAMAFGAFYGLKPHDRPVHYEEKLNTMEKERVEHEDRLEKYREEMKLKRELREKEEKAKEKAIEEKRKAISGEVEK